jgi:hypothetical protein
MKDHIGHSPVRVTSDPYGHQFPRARQELAGRARQELAGRARRELRECSLGRRGPPAVSVSGAVQKALTGPLAAVASIPSRNRPPSAPSKRGGRPGQGSPALLAPAPQQQVMRRTNPGQVGSVLPHPGAYAHRIAVPEPPVAGSDRPARTRTEHRARTRDLGRRTETEPAFCASIAVSAHLPLVSH